MSRTHMNPAHRLTLWLVSLKDGTTKFIRAATHADAWEMLDDWACVATVVRAN